MEEILTLFHHIHHHDGEHQVHHCGGKHGEFLDIKLDYTIDHCICGKHRIDKKKAVGHAMGGNLESIEVEVLFEEACPEGGWHIEGGSKA